MSESKLHALEGVARNALLLFYATSTPGDHATIFYGRPGSAKTKVCEAVGTALGVDSEHFVRWSAGQMDVPDWNGYPTPRPDGLHFESPAAVRRLCDGRPSMFLVDEMGNVDRSVQAAMLRPFDSRYIGEQKLPQVDLETGGGCRVVGAMNPPDSTTDMHDTAFTLMNRAVWLPWQDVTEAEHARYVRSRRNARVNIELPERVSPAVWWRCYDELAAVYAVFRERVHGGVLYEDEKSEAVRARWPMVAATPRSWDIFLCLAATCHAYQDNSAMREMGKGTIGEPCTNEWMAFYEEQDLMDPALLVGPEGVPNAWTPDPKRGDRTYAQTLLVSGYATSERGTPSERAARWDKAWAFTQHLLDSGEQEDVLLLSVQELFEKIPPGVELRKHRDTIVRFRQLSTVAATFNDGGGR